MIDAGHAGWFRALEPEEALSHLRAIHDFSIHTAAHWTIAELTDLHETCIGGHADA